MWDHPLIIAFALGTIVVLLLIIDWRTTGYLRRFVQAKLSRPPELIDLAAETPEGVDDSRPTWLLLTSATPAWNADDVAEICARVWNVPVNEHDHDINFVIGEAPCMMLRHGDWHYLLTIGDESYMDPEQVPESADSALREAFSAQQSWYSLSVVGAPDGVSLQSDEALRHSGKLVAQLSGDVGLVLFFGKTSTTWTWTSELAAEMQRGDLSRIVL